MQHPKARDADEYLDAHHVDSLDSLESHKLEHLEAQLIAMFSPPLRPEEVQRCLIDCVARYESARVRQYLPLLVERDATQRLRDVSRGRLARPD